jgi:HEPN domain-containing protein
VNRIDFQQLAELRLEDARALLHAGRYSGAFYLSGYAIECALKSCVSKLTREFDFPDKALANQAHTHEITKLIDAAGLRNSWDRELSRDSELSKNWAIVRDWSEVSRYQALVGQQRAIDVIEAIADPSHGVLQCIRKYW